MLKKLLIISLTLFISVATYSDWSELAPGIELGKFKTASKSSVGESEITIVRINPALWELALIAKSENENAKSKSAKQWSESNNLALVINAGMFGQDYKTHIGYMATEKHTNNKRITKYQSVAAFSPKSGKSIPAFKMFDLDDPLVKMEQILEDYSSVVQNLRLIKKPGENRWSQQNRKWSEAALGEDASGNALFIFSRSPFTMHDLNNELLGLDIGLIAAQHLEGGPEAQLYIKVGEHEYEMFGSFETSFVENDRNPLAWPIPNIIGVRQANKEQTQTEK